MHHPHRRMVEKVHGNVAVYPTHRMSEGNQRIELSSYIFFFRLNVSLHFWPLMSVIMRTKNIQIEPSVSTINQVNHPRLLVYLYPKMKTKFHQIYDNFSS